MKRRIPEENGEGTARIDLFHWFPYKDTSKMGRTRRNANFPWFLFFGLFNILRLRRSFSSIIPMQPQRGTGSVGAQRGAWLGCSRTGHFMLLVLHRRPEKRKNHRAATGRPGIVRTATHVLRGVSSSCRMIQPRQATGGPKLLTRRRQRA